MRIEGLEASLGPNVAVNLSPTIKKWNDKEEEALVMGPTGRSFPVQKGARSRSTGAIKPLRPVAPPRRMDLSELVKALKLGANKIRVLKMLRRRDWIKLLHLMPKELLVNALRFFSKEKLLRMIMHLPKPLLLKLLLRVVKMADLIKKMPTVELMRILRSHKLQNRELAKGIMKLEPKFIMLLLERIYGGSYDYSKLKPYDLFRIFMQTNKERLTEALKTMPFKVLQQLVGGFVKQDPELLLHLSDRFIFKLLEKRSKCELIQGCTVLPEDILIRMLCQLPDPLLMLAAAQVDDQVFEDFLMAQHADLLEKLAGVA
ncbi:MAG: hypothetical protein K0Q50_1897 [Vampirovibrio sp.]|jgi:hypothetical protein|nr:hypothetical protein [Vampirovibrio sp.]